MKSEQRKPLVPIRSIPKQENTTNTMLIWLDKKSNENSPDCQHTISQLQTVSNNVRSFTVKDECIQYLKTTRCEKIYMIISGSLGQQVVQVVHDLSHVDSILIFCKNKQYHDQWAKDWQKIKDVCTDIKNVCDTLKKLIHTEEPNIISFSLLTTEDESSISTNLDQLDPMFVYMQVLKEILPVIKYEKKHISEFTKYCHEQLKQNNNENQLKNITLFENNYSNKTSMWWFTKESFLYSILSQAIQSFDIDTIIKSGFFIRDLQCQIGDFHVQQFSRVSSRKIYTFYRVQTITQEEYDQICKAHGGLISFHSFQFATTSKTVALNSLKHTLLNSDLINVLFVMTIRSKTSTTIFASATTANATHDQANEILFGLQTIFRIKNVKKSDDHSNLFIIELEWTRNNDDELGILMNHIREQTFTKREGWDRLGSVLLRLNDAKNAEKIYQFLLQEEMKDIEKAWIYQQLGTCKYHQESHLKAIKYYKKSMNIYEAYPSNDANLIVCYNQTGKIYEKTNEFTQAISFYEKTLLLQQSSLGSSHPDLAETYHNIGTNYFKLNDYTNALASYGKALDIGQQSISPDDSDLARYYNAIGMIYKQQHEYSKAFPYYEKALLIQKRSSSTNQTDLATYYHNIGTVYCMMNEYEKALSCHEKALKIQQELSALSNNPFDLASLYDSIGLVYENMKDYPHAQSYYTKAVNIGKDSSLETYPDMQQWINHLAQIKNK